MIVAVPVYAVALTGFGGLTKEDLEDIPLSAQSAGSGQAFWLF